jgi:hypothetical protein
LDFGFQSEGLEQISFRATPWENHQTIIWQPEGLRQPSQIGAGI